MQAAAFTTQYQLAYLRVEGLLSHSSTDCFGQKVCVPAFDNLLRAERLDLFEQDRFLILFGHFALLFKHRGQGRRWSAGWP
jgi:hypothetical protein